MQKIKKYIKNKNKPIAVVLNLGGTGLGVIRSLGRRGIPVIGLDSSFFGVGFFSRYCKSIVCPDPETKEAEYIDFLLSIGEQLNIKGVLIPTGDVEVLAISKYRDKLEKYYKFPMAKLALIEKLVNKRKFYEMLEKLDVPYPKTYFPNDVSDIKEISKEITYPYVVKPIFSTNFGKEFSAKVFKVNSAEELVKAYNKATSSGHEVMIQDVIHGSDANIYGFCSYFNCKSEPLGTFIYKKIRGYPEGFGLCSFVESVFEPKIVKLATQLLQSINYHGISEVEFKKDQRDDTFKIIEINARTWGENSLAAKCGVDLSYMAYMDAIGKEVEKVISWKEGVKWLYMFNDTLSAFERISKDELSIIKWIISLRGEKEYAIFTQDDPLPFFISPFNLSSVVLRFLLKRLRK